MYHIAICDDEEVLISELKENLIQYAAETGKEFCFFLYRDGSELLADYRPDYDLIFMDIKMEKLNGLQTAEEIHSRYGLRLLGVFETSGNQKKRFLSGIDNLLFRLKNRRKKNLPVERQLEVISANIALSCRQSEIDSIYMTGSEYEKADKGLLDKLKKEVAKQNIKVLDGGNIMYDAVSVKSAMEIGNIVLVELKGISAYNEIDREIDLFKQYHANILGVIVMS